MATLLAAGVCRPGAERESQELMIYRLIPSVIRSSHSDDHTLNLYLLPYHIDTYLFLYIWLLYGLNIYELVFDRIPPDVIIDLHKLLKNTDMKPLRSMTFIQQYYTVCWSCDESVILPQSVFTVV